MKFIQYINISSIDEDQRTFRSLNIGIIKDDDTEYMDIIKKYDTDDIVETINQYNKRLKTILGRNQKLGFYINEQENIHSIDINNKKRERLLKKIDEFNNHLAIIQKKFERNVQSKNLHTDI